MLEITAVVVILGILTAMGAAGVYAVRSIGDMRISTGQQPAPSESQSALSDRVTALTERVKQLEGEVSAWEARCRTLMGTVGKLKQQITSPGDNDEVDNSKGLDDLLRQYAQDDEESLHQQPFKTRQIRRR